MNSKSTYKPVAFFLITFIITWNLLFTASYFSYQEGTEDFLYLIFAAAAFGPLIATLIMHFHAKSSKLWKDFGNRIINLKLIKLSTLPLLFFLLPFAMIIAIIISLPFGGSANQFTLIPKGTINMGGASILFFTVLYPVVEELGWRGYGVDSIRSHFNLFKTSLIFGAVWALWHAPMFFVKGSYMNNCATEWIFVVNYFLSVVAMGFIMNWLFYKNNRSIIYLAIFHITANQTAEIFAVTQYTKCINTGVLILFVILITIFDRKFFFDNKIVL